MKVFAWNAAHEKDTVMTPHDSIRYHKQMLQASFVCMDPKSGEIKCWVGGINHKWFKYDHVTAERQVGSAFKPLLYTLAVKDLNYTPASIIPGGSITLSGKTLSGVSTPLANCLANSINYAAFQLINAVGIDRTVAFAHDCGIKVNLQPYPSLALGAAEIPILQLLQAYTMFPGKGLNTTPVFITSIEDKNGNVLETFKTSTKELIGENDAYTMVSMMQGVVQKGTARALNGYGIPVAMAGKTGTTTGNADGWFMGYTPELLAGTWVGCDDPFIQIYKYGTSGGNEMALPNWGAFMKKVYADKRLHYGAINKFPMPADSMKLILQADIDNLIRPDTTGQPNPDSSSKDYFIEEPENNNKPLNNIDTAGFNEKMLRPQNQHP
jgi:penicillin-binding protein 1A